MTNITKEQAAQLAYEAGGVGYVHDAGDTPHKWQFSLEELEAFAKAVFKLGRNAGLEEARLRAVIHSQYPITIDYDRGYDKARKDCASAIESLKDNTP